MLARGPAWRGVFIITIDLIFNEIINKRGPVIKVILAPKAPVMKVILAPDCSLVSARLPA